MDQEPGGRRRRKDAEAHFAASALAESGSVGLSLTQGETKPCSVSLGEGSLPQPHCQERGGPGQGPPGLQILPQMSLSPWDRCWRLGRAEGLLGGLIGNLGSSLEAITGSKGTRSPVPALPVRASWQPWGARTRLLLLFAPEDILGAFSPASLPVSIAVMGMASPSNPQPPARHPGRKVTACLGEEGNGQLERRPNPRTGHREGASSDGGCCSLEPLLRRTGMSLATSRHGSTGDSTGDLVLGSGTQLGTQQGCSQLRSWLRASPGKSKCSGCHAPAARGDRRSLPCQRCIPPAPWQLAEQLVQSGRLQKAL